MQTLASTTQSAHAGGVEPGTTEGMKFTPNHGTERGLLHSQRSPYQIAFRGLGEIHVRISTHGASPLLSTSVAFCLAEVWLRMLILYCSIAVLSGASWRRRSRRQHPLVRSGENHARHQQPKIVRIGTVMGALQELYRSPVILLSKNIDRPT